MRRRIVVSGLPGAGKSTLAGSLADALKATVLVKDVIEASLWRRNVGREQESFLVAHEVMTALAVELHYVMADIEKLWRRIVARGLQGSGVRTIRRDEVRPIQRHELAEWFRIYEPPTDEEMADYDRYDGPPTSARS